MNSVKNNIKRFRLEQRLTQDELAKKLHVARQTVSSWEMGKTTPSLETLTSIAEALNVSVNELIYGPASIDAFASKRLKRIKYAVILTLAAIVFGLIGVFWTKILAMIGITDTFYADFNPRSFGHLMHMLGGGAFPATFYILLGIATVMMIESWRDFSSLNKRVRYGAFLIGLVLLLCYAITLFLVMTGVCYSQMVLRIFYFVYPKQFVMFVSGMLLGVQVADTV